MAQVRRIGGNRLIDFAGEGLEIVFRPARFKPAEQALLSRRWRWIHAFHQYPEFASWN